MLTLWKETRLLKKINQHPTNGILIRLKTAQHKVTIEEKKENKKEKTTTLITGIPGILITGGANCC